MAVENRYTNIISQNNTGYEDGGAPALTIFTTVDQAKNFFFTANALQCMEDHSTQVAWALVADANGDYTRLKRTLGFDLSGQGQQYNNRMIELIAANDWGVSPVDGAGAYTTVETTDPSEHLF